MSNKIISLFKDKPPLDFFERVANGDLRPNLVSNLDILNEKFSSLLNAIIDKSDTDNPILDIQDIALKHKHAERMKITLEDGVLNYEIFPEKEQLYNIKIYPYMGNVNDAGTELEKFYDKKCNLYHDAYEIEDKRVREMVSMDLQNSNSPEEFGFKISKIINKAFDIIDHFKLMEKEYSYNDVSLYEPNNLIVKNGKTCLDFLIKNFLFKYEDYLFEGDKGRIISIIDFENKRHEEFSNSFKERTKNLKTQSTFKWEKTKKQREELLKLLIKNEFIFSTTTPKQFEIWFSGDKPKKAKRITWVCKSSKNKMPNKKALCYLIKLLIDNRLIDRIYEPPNTKHKNFMSIIANTFVDIDDNSMTITNANIKGCETNEQSLLLEKIIEEVTQSSLNQNT